MKRLLCLICLAAATLQGSPPDGASAQRVSPALMGFLPQDGGVRITPVFGVAGAAYAGAPLALAGEGSRWWMAPGQEYALVESGGGPLDAVLLDAKGGVEARAALAGLRAPRTGAIVFSPSAEWAALYDEAAGTVRRVSGLPADARDRGAIAAPGRLRVLAIGDAGQIFAGDEQGAIYRLSADAAPHRVHHSPGLSAMAFLPRSEKAAACDRESGAVVLLDGTAAPAVLGEVQGADRVAATADGRYVAAAGGGTKRIAWFDLQSGAAGSVECPAPVSALERLRDGRTFAVAQDAGGVSWVLELAGEGRLFFVPPSAGGVE